MKPGRIVSILIIIFIAIVLYVNKCGKSNPATGPTQKGGTTSAIQVNGFIVKPSTVSEIVHVTGSLLSNKEVEIRNEIGGKLVKIYFQEGGYVNKGELLVKIYDEDLQAQLKKLKLDEQLLKINEERLRDLLSIQGVSQQEYDESLNSLQRAAVEIELLQVQISRTEIRAPFSGHVGLEAVNEGSLLAINTRIVTIQETNPMKLEFSVPERYKSSIKLNQTVDFTLEADTREHEARIYAMEPKIDAITRSVLIRASCANTTGELTPGAFARVNVPLSDMESALMIPSQAIIPELKGYKLFLQKNGKAMPVKVNLGIRNDSTVQMLSGIEPGDTILTNGIMQLRPEMPVIVKID